MDTGPTTNACLEYFYFSAAIQFWSFAFLFVCLLYHYCEMGGLEREFRDEKFNEKDLAGRNRFTIEIFG